MRQQMMNTAVQGIYNNEYPPLIWRQAMKTAGGQGIYDNIHPLMW